MRLILRNTSVWRVCPPPPPPPPPHPGGRGWKNKRDENLMKNTVRTKQWEWKRERQKTEKRLNRENTRESTSKKQIRMKRVRVGVGNVMNNQNIKKDFKRNNSAFDWLVWSSPVQDRQCVGVMGGNSLWRQLLHVEVRCQRLPERLTAALGLPERSSGRSSATSRHQAMTEPPPHTQLPSSLTVCKQIAVKSLSVQGETFWNRCSSIFKQEEKGFYPMKNSEVCCYKTKGLIAMY